MSQVAFANSRSPTPGEPIGIRVRRELGPRLLAIGLGVLWPVAPQVAFVGASATLITLVSGLPQAAASAGLAWAGLLLARDMRLRLSLFVIGWSVAFSSTWLDAVLGGPRIYAGKPWLPLRPTSGWAAAIALGGSGRQAFLPPLMAAVEGLVLLMPAIAVTLSMRFGAAQEVVRMPVGGNWNRGAGVGMIACSMLASLFVYASVVAGGTTVDVATAARSAAETFAYLIPCLLAACCLPASWWGRLVVGASMALPIVISDAGPGDGGSWFAPRPGSLWVVLAIAVAVPARHIDGAVSRTTPFALAVGVNALNVIDLISTVSGEHAGKIRETNPLLQTSWSMSAKFVGVLVLSLLLLRLRPTSLRYVGYALVVVCLYHLLGLLVLNVAPGG